MSHISPERLFIFLRMNCFRINMGKCGFLQNKWMPGKIANLLIQAGVVGRDHYEVHRLYTGETYT